MCGMLELRAVDPRRSARVEHGPMPSAVRSWLFHVVISTALSVVPRK